MNFKFIFLTSLLVAGCAFIKVSAFPQDEAFPQADDEQDSTSTGSSNPGFNEMDSSTDNDNSFNNQSSTEGGEGNFELGPNVSPTETPFLNTVTEIRQYLVSKLREIYRSLKGCKNKMDVEKATLLDFDHLPKFEDPLYIGNFTEKYKLADVSFYNVAVRGMNDFRSADMHTDQEHRNVDLQLVAPSLQITGSYFLKNFIKKTSGPFTVKLCDNITYHEASIYCRMKQEIDIAASKCGIRYGKSENNYGNLGWFTGLFRGSISNPMIDQVLQKVGKEIGHKMRPILLSMLQKTVVGKETNDDTGGSGLATLIRSTVSETRNLMMKDEYKNFQLEGDAKIVQYGTYDVSFQTIQLHGVNRFEIINLDLPVLSDKLVIHLTVHDTNINGSANIQFTNRGIQAKTDIPVNVVPFEIEDLRADILLEKKLSSDQMKFDVSAVNVTAVKLITHSPQGSIIPEIEVAVRDFAPSHLQTMISERLTILTKLQIENILNEAATEESDHVDSL